MKFYYSTNVRLCVSEIKPEELATIMGMGSIDKYGPIVDKVYPDCEYDYEGCPIKALGTYTVVFKDAWHSTKIENAIDDQLERMKEIEKMLTE